MYMPTCLYLSPSPYALHLGWQDKELLGRSLECTIDNYREWLKSYFKTFTSI